MAAGTKSAAEPANRGGWVRKKIETECFGRPAVRREKCRQRKKMKENGYQVRLIDSEGARRKSSATCGRESLRLRPLLEEQSG